MNDFSKTLIFLGILLIAAGLVAGLAGKIPGLGRLPGDFYFRRGSFTLYFPLATSLLISLILTLVFSFFGKK